MSSTLKRSFLPQKSKKNTIAAQELIKLRDTVFKNGLLRKRTKKPNIGKWPHRFVVLTYDSMYIFRNETSSAQDSKYHLFGYNRVARTEIRGHNWCFSIVPANFENNLETKTFACVSEEERKSWMKAIRNQLFAANDIKNPIDSILKKHKSNSLTDDEEYAYLERIVYVPDENIIVRKNSKNFDNDDDCEDESSASSCGTVNVHDSKEKSNMVSVSCEESKDSDSDYDKIEVPKTVPENKPKKIQRKLSSDLRPKEAESSSLSSLQPSTGSLPPPRYSEVVEDDSNNSSVYMNLPQDKPQPPPPRQPSLETMCTVTDSNPDREQLVTMLQAKKEPGTYLIRNSRESDNKVLAFLNDSGRVKEFRIIETDARLTLDKKNFFTSINHLLKHYTSVEPLPQTEQRLKNGIYQTDRTG